MRIQILFILALVAVAVSFKADKPVGPQTNLQEVLIALGEQPPKHYIAEPDPKLVALGYELTHEARAKTADGYSPYISTIFVCTDCHNQVQEDPVLGNPNPEARLTYAIQNNLPFLQATTFWGMVNRETWYNDDYVKKYGDWIAPAKESLYESTQLCARECSSGRPLEQWEWEAFQHYYWSLQLRLGDLDNMTESDYNRISQAIRSESKDMKSSAISFLKSRYMTFSPAHFTEAPSDRKKGYEGTTAGNPEVGKEIYDRSCKTCHQYGGPSLFTLDEAKTTFKMLKKNIAKFNDYSLYQITRYGTHAEPGHRQYMPLYTLDRLSNQQLEDLKAYIVKRASK
ncbi:MAG: hypothetical protein RL226_1781 [Bacteroidota bacterium]|jgi:mono/diheme cytochrome c family protein